MNSDLSVLSEIDAALHNLAARLAIVDFETIAPAPGRVLATSVNADRDSPAIDVSAMDGYAIRLADLMNPLVPVAGETQAGQPPQTLPSGAVLRIFTGAPVPSGCEAVVMREHTDESDPQRIRWLEPASGTTRGLNIRFCGENGKAGDGILPPGVVLTPAMVAATASFGAAQVDQHRTVRVTVIVTGNELLDIAAMPQPWQIRDSNGPTIAAACAAHRWIDCQRISRCRDDAAELRSQLDLALDAGDAVILTGGVSKGDYDHVPGVIASSGAEIVFHRLPMRPGRPILGAATPDGKLILGLPGNPVSALVGMTRFGVPLLAKQSGQSMWQPRANAMVELANDFDKTLPLHWFRLVKSMNNATVEVIDTRGSGDLVALATSTGFIHQPPGKTGSGPWEYFRWCPT